MAGEQRIQNVKLPYSTFAEQASGPATPDAGHARLYRSTDGSWYEVDDAGVSTLLATTPWAAIEVLFQQPQAGDQIAVKVPFDCSLAGGEGSLVADQVGSIVIDVWRDTQANHPPTDADSITASAPLTLSSQIQKSDTALIGWTLAMNKGDILIFNVDSVSTVTWVLASLIVKRT